MYVPWLQEPDYLHWAGQLTVRVSGGADVNTEALRRRIEDFGHEYAASIKTVDQVARQALFKEWMAAQLASCFAIVGVLLASIGLYGVLSFHILRRTREIGIRMALGAEPRMMLRAVLQKGLLLVLIGVAIGLPAAFAATRVIASLLSGVATDYPSIWVGMPLVLMLVGTLAVYLPARRAARMDPAVALRHE